MKQTVFKNVKIKSKAYRKLMEFVGQCTKSGGWVDFVHNGEFVDCTLNWEV